MKWLLLCSALLFLQTLCAPFSSTVIEDEDEEEGKAESNVTIAAVLNNLVNWLQPRNAVASHLRKPLLSDEAPVGKKDTDDTKEDNKK